MKHEVSIEYKGVNYYLVDADTPEQAAAIAKQRYQAGDNGNETLTNWENILSMGVNGDEVQIPA